MNKASYYKKTEDQHKLTFNVIVSESFCVTPSLTDLWAALCNLLVFSIASLSSLRRYPDLTRASSASPRDPSASGVYGPRGSARLAPSWDIRPSIEVLLRFNEFALEGAELTIEDKAWHKRSRTRLLSWRTAKRRLLAASSTCRIIVGFHVRVKLCINITHSLHKFNFQLQLASFIIL